MRKKFLDTAYGATSVDATKGFYNEWADSYDAEIGDNGYQTPIRLAKLLCRNIKDLSDPVLDFGCGTGISGEALQMAGFSRLDGLDISKGMLDHARAKGVYRRLSLLDPNDAWPVAKGEYATITAVGVVSTGGAPPETLDTLMKALEPGGRLAFSYNDHTLIDPAYMDRLAFWVENGAQEIDRNYGPHLPGINLNSMIYLLEKK